MSQLINADLSSLVPDRNSHQAVLVPAGTETGRQQVRELLEQGAVLSVHDQLEEQLLELMDTRHPMLRGVRERLLPLVQEQLAGRSLESYGVWVYYPWSKRLVHLLPEQEFRELRTSRNRNKITREEQERLAKLAIGVVGLSVGQATAITLALEGVGGELRLADFDRLSLSNMNRLRAGVHSIGVNKAVLTAREILEVNPFASIRLFESGINQDNLDQFLVGGGKLDLVVEECDDLEVKVRIRERARELRIPVVMETSDRGMIDIERFDLEADRPLFHGLVGDLRAADLRGLTTYQKVPVVLDIIGARTMSPRMAASLIDIDITLKTWPQLASAVALGGAIATDTARRIGLGELTVSGRFCVDLDQIIAARQGGETTDTQAGPASEQKQAASPADPESMIRIPLPGSNWPAQARALVRYAVLAPSGGNCQPWSFLARDRVIECRLDRERAESILDFQNLASYLACGASSVNLELAAWSMGLEAEVRAFPIPNQPLIVYQARLADARRTPPAQSALFGRVTERCTNRRTGERVPLKSQDRERLLAAAELEGARLQIVTEPEKLDAIAEILGEGDRLRFLSRGLHHDMFREVRWTQAQTLGTRDGLDIETLELDPTARAGIRLVASWPLMRMTRMLNAGHGLGKATRDAIGAASAVGLLTIRGKGPTAFFQGGRALEYVWLTATECELSFQPVTALLYLFLRLEGGNQGLDNWESAVLRDLYQKTQRLFELRDDESPLMLFRLAKCAPPTARSIRRPVDDILRFDNLGTETE